MNKQNMENSLQQYKKIKLLGSGGQGEVFLVEAQNGKRYALKVYDKDTTRAEIGREIELLHKLKHNNIVDIKEFGYLKDGQIYTVAQYFSQGSIVDVEEKRFLSVRDKLSIYRDIGSALQYLHDNKVVHRDIKPGNIFVKKIRNSYKGYLGDFGVAKQTEDSMLTRSLHGGVGTELYLPPEVLLNEEKPSFSSDIYAYGTSMYQSLTGNLPYGDTTQELINQLQSPQLPQPLSEFLHNTPEKLEVLLQEMIHHTKASRRIDLVSSITTLDDLLNGEEIDMIASKEEENPYTSQVQGNKNKVFLSLLTGASVLLAGYGIYLATQHKKNPRKKIVKKVQPEEIKEDKIKEEIVQVLEEKVHKKTELPEEKVWKGLQSFYGMKIEALEPLIQNLIENNQQLPSGYVDDLYLTVKYLQENRNMGKHVELYRKAMGGVVFLKTEYSQFTKEEVEGYWKCDATPVEHTKEIHHIPQYTFLRGIAPFSTSSVAINKFAQYMYGFLLNKDRYRHINQTLNKLNGIKDKKFQNIKQELYMDTFLHAATDLEPSIRMSLFILNKMYFKHISMSNKHMKPFKFGQDPKSYQEVQRLDVLYEFSELVKKDLEKQNKEIYKEYITYYKNLNERYVRTLSQYKKDLNFVPVKIDLNIYRTTILKCKSVDRGLLPFAQIQNLIAHTKLIHLLYKKAYEYSQEITEVESERIMKKKIKILYELIKGTPEEKRKEYARKFLDVQKDYYKKYLSTGYEHFALFESLVSGRIGPSFTDKDNTFFTNHIEYSLNNKQIKQEQLAVREFLQIQSNYKNYANLINFFKNTKDLYPMDEFTNKNLTLDSLILLTNAYIQENKSEEGKTFMNEYKFREKSIEVLQEYVTTNGTNTKAKVGTIVRLLGILTELYKDEKELENNKVKKTVYNLSETYFKELYGVSDMEAYEPYNIFTARLDITRGYMHYLDTYAEKNEIVDFLNEERSLKWYYKSKIIQKDELYLRALNYYNQYIGLVEKHSTNNSLPLGNEIKKILQSKVIKELAMDNNKLAKEYKSLMKTYKQYLQNK